MIKSFLCIALFIFFCGSLLAQSVIVGTGVPDNSAMLEVKSTDKGMLIPRMTSVQKKAISQPAKGLLVYQTDSVPGFYYNEGTPAIPRWKSIQNSTNAVNNAALDQWATAPLSFAELSTGQQVLKELAFDGENIWGYLSVNNTNNLYRVRASDGGYPAYFSVTGTPQKILFDGTYIVVFTANTLFRLNPQTGAIVNQLTQPATADIKDIVFDGTHYWLVPNNSRVAQILTSSLAGETSVNVGPNGTIADDILFDGRNVWALGHTPGNNNYYIRKMDIASLTTIFSTAPSNPYVYPAPVHIAFDGVNIWISFQLNSLERRSGTDGASLDFVGTSSPGPVNEIRYDGNYIWAPTGPTATTFTTSISKIKAADETVVPVPFLAPNRVFYASVFDGTAIWISSVDGTNAGFLTKIPM